MTWLYRYLLNLPARVDDIEEIKKDFPELLQEGFSPKGISANGFLDIDVRIQAIKIRSHFHGDIDDLFKGLESWLKNVNQENKSDIVDKNCPLKEDCPKRTSNKISEDENILKIMTIA